MILWPKVKEFIELYIEDIEKENTKYLFDESREYLNDVEFNQFYDILSDLDYQYDLDQFINEIIDEIYREIIKENDGEYICIEDKWNKYSSHHFGDKDRIIELFDEFESDIKNGKHWCTVYEY